MPPADALSERFGIIGLGAFGALMARELARVGEVVAFDSDASVRAPEGVSLAPFETVAASPVVVLAVNAQRLSAVIDAVSPYLSEGAVVADVCSVKVRPIDLMLEGLPRHARVVGTHPLFGPQTVGEKGLAGQPIALCEGRADGDVMDRARALLAETLGLRVVETSADEHDRQMAFVQALTHLVGHAANDMDLPNLDLATLAYRRLLQLKGNILGDSEELFEAIQQWNPHAAGVRARFLDAMHAVHDRAGPA